MRIYLIFAALIAGAESDFTLQIELSRETAQIGNKLEAKCDVKNPKGNEFMVRWVKRIGQEEIPMAVNSYLEDDFKKTGRYETDIETPNDNFEHVIFVLKINDVQPEDSGELGCLIDTRNVGAFQNFTVYGPVTSLALTSFDMDGTHAASYSNGQNVTFNEDDKRKFFCHVNGSYPQPVVKMMIGDTDITHLFTKEVKLQKTNGANKLKKLSYDVTLKNESFAIRYKYSSKRLKCSATIPKSNLPEKSIEIFVKLNEYKPKFDCDNNVMVAKNQMNFEIRCSVRADPPIDNLNFYWSAEGDNKTLESGQRDGHYIAEVSPVDQYESEMILKIDRVYDQHFRTYYFEAENKLGKVIHEVQLSMDPNASTGSGEVHVHVSALVFVISFLLAALL